MTESVIALDPGGRSGWASALMSEDKLVLTGGGVMRQDLMARWLADQQVVAAASLPASVQRMAKEMAVYGVIVCESWRPFPKDGSMAWIQGDPLLSAQHVGQIRLIADLSGARYVEQPPSSKTMYTASMPKKLLDLDVYSSEQHDKDARMHLWGYFKENWFTASQDPESVVYT